MAEQPSLAMFSDRVLLPEGLGPAVVHVQGARIERVEAVSACPPGALDLSGHLVAPSFVNAHTHLPMSAFRALGGVAGRANNVIEDVWFAVESRMTAADVRAFTRVAALEVLLGGTGAVFEHYYHGEALAQAFVDVGLTGVIAPTVQDLSGPGVPQRAAQIEATLAIHHDAELAAKGIRSMWGPHATDTVSEEVFRELLALPAELPVHVHVAQSIEELRRARRGGRTPIEALGDAGVLERPALLVHALFVSASDRERLDPERHVLGHCPWSQTQFAWPAHLDPWLDAGFAVAVGTDAGACNDTMNVQQELRLMATGPMYQVATHETTYALLGNDDAAEGLAARRRHAFQRTARQADPLWLLSTVGTAPGRLVPELGLGEIRAGALANIAVWDLQHPALWPARDPLRALTFGDATPALHSLLVAGRWIGEVGDVRSLLRQEVVRDWVREATERLEALLP